MSGANVAKYCLMVTGPAYGTQQASSAYQFAQALISSGHNLVSVFFYREGVLNANQLTAPANDEFDLVRAWQQLALNHSIELNVCVAAALRVVLLTKMKLTNSIWRARIYNPVLP